MPRYRVRTLPEPPGAVEETSLWGLAWLLDLLQRANEQYVAAADGAAVYASVAAMRAAGEDALAAVMGAREAAMTAKRRGGAPPLLPPLVARPNVVTVVQSRLS